ncbi:MAG: protein kinase domain-containing protein [Myxococcaceae bacterium]
MAVPAQQQAIPFGDYFLLKRIAVGGMAELFLAEDSRTKKLVVIKRILPYLASEPEFVQMFLDEARIAAQLHHRNIVEVKELGKLGEHIFIAMEFLDGIDLRRVLQQEQKRQQSVPFAVGAYIVARICDGLHYAHNRVGLDGKPLELIHRDISPQNVMVAYTGDVKLVDFGIAKASAVVERSKPGVIKGKYLYLAPEQLTQERLDHRADLFAVGTMLYEITTGKSPFAKTTTEAVILAIRNEEPPPPHLVRSDFPLGLSRIITKCMAKDRTRRYQQAGEIRDDLDDFVTQSLPMNQFGLKTYIARLFGNEDDRTMVNLPERPGPPVPDQEPEDTTASTSSDKFKMPLTGPRGDAEVTRPTAPDARAQEDEDNEPRTQTARPEDIARAFAAPLPQRRGSGVNYAQAGASDERTQMADESTRLGPPEPADAEEHSEASQPTPSVSSFKGRRPTGGFTPTNESPPPPPVTRGERKSPAPVFDAPVLPQEPSTANERRKHTAQSSKVTSRPNPKQPPRPPDRDEDESTADFRLSRIGKLPKLTGWLDNERTAMIVAVSLLVAGLIALVAVIISRTRGHDETPTRPPVEKLHPKQQQPEPRDDQTGATPVVTPKVDPQKTAEENAAKPDAGLQLAANSDEQAMDNQDQAQEPPPEQKQHSAPDKTAVIFKAPAGTQIKVGKQSVVPGKQYRYAAGALRFTYRCPARGSRTENRTEKVARGRSTQTIVLKCSK